MTPHDRERGLDPNSAIKTYFQDPDWMFKTGMGGMLNAASLVLCALSHLFIPVAFLMWGVTTGYILRAARQELTEQYGKLPDWNNWADLLVSGLTWMAIFTGQIMFVVTVASTTLILGLTTGMINASSANFIPWALGSLYGVAFLSATTGFFSSLLMINFAREERLSGAFNTGAVLSRLKKKPMDFILAWLMGFGLHWCAIVLPTLSVIGIFFIPSAWFIAQILSARLLAQVFLLSDTEPQTATA